MLWYLVLYLAIRASPYADGRQSWILIKVFFGVSEAVSGFKPSTGVLTLAVVFLSWLCKYRLMGV